MASTIVDNTQVEPQDLQQPTPENTHTSLNFDEMVVYPAQTQAFITNNHYIDGQALPPSHMSRNVETSMTSDSSYHTQDPSTQHSPLAEVFRQRQNPEIPVVDPTQLGEGWVPDPLYMQEPVLGNDFDLGTLFGPYNSR